MFDPRVGGSRLGSACVLSFPSFETLPRLIKSWDNMRWTRTSMGYFDIYCWPVTHESLIVNRWCTTLYAFSRLFRYPTHISHIYCVELDSPLEKRTDDLHTFEFCCLPGALPCWRVLTRTKQLSAHSASNLTVRMRKVLVKPRSILVPRGRDPFGQHQNSRPLAGSNFWNMRRGLLLYFKPIRFARFDNESADFRSWSLLEVSILSADQKDRGLWGREWPRRRVVWTIAFYGIVMEYRNAFSCFMLMKRELSASPNSYVPALASLKWFVMSYFLMILSLFLKPVSSQYCTRRHCQTCVCLVGLCAV